MVYNLYKLLVEFRWVIKDFRGCQNIIFKI